MTSYNQIQVWWYGQTLTDMGDDQWMPNEIRFTGEIHFGIPIPGIPKQMEFSHVAALDSFRFDIGETPKTIGVLLIVVDEGADDVDSTTWGTDRTIPLTSIERDAYQRIDSIEQQPASARNGSAIEVMLPLSPGCSGR